MPGVSIYKASLEISKLQILKQDISKYLRIARMSQGIIDIQGFHGDQQFILKEMFSIDLEEGRSIPHQVF